MSINFGAHLTLFNIFRRTHGEYSKADIPAEDANRLDMTRFTSRLGLEHDVVISLFIKDCETFNRFLPIMPFYQNVLKDGVVLNA
jgi:hypothetical protein